MRTILLGDVGNRLDIGDAEREISSLRRRQASASHQLRAKKREVKQLSDEVAELRLATQALTRFLIDKQIIDTEQLEEFISEVDAEDGVVDGKLTIDTSQNKKRLRLEKGTDIPPGTYKL